MLSGMRRRAVEGFDRCGGRVRVEGHFENGRHTTGGRSACAGFPTLPLRSTRLVEVDVRIYDTGEHHETAGVDHHFTVTDFAADCRDDSISDGDVSGLLAGGKDDDTATNKKVGSRS
jgi:hypothetical protein